MKKFQKTKFYSFIIFSLILFFSFSNHLFASKADACDDDRNANADFCQPGYCDSSSADQSLCTTPASPEPPPAPESTPGSNKISGWYQCSRHGHNDYKNCGWSSTSFPYRSDYTRVAMSGQFVGHRHGGSMIHLVAALGDEVAYFQGQGNALGTEYGGYHPWDLLSAFSMNHTDFSSPWSFTVTYFAEVKDAEGAVSFTGEANYPSSNNATGQITINTVNESGSVVNAPWNMSGPENYSGSGSDSMLKQSGTYTITPGDLAGYTKPAQSTKNLSDNGAITFTLIYTRTVSAPASFNISGSCFNWPNPQIEINSDRSTGASTYKIQSYGGPWEDITSDLTYEQLDRHTISDVIKGQAYKFQVIATNANGSTVSRNDRTITVNANECSANGGVAGQCGTANKEYPPGSNSYGGDTFCKFGTPSKNPPDFPEPGNFVTWYCAGDVSNNQCSASVPVPKHNLVVRKPTGGTIKSMSGNTPDGNINCGLLSSICSHQYDKGSTVYLKAFPASSYFKFVGWATNPNVGCDSSGKTLTCSITVVGDITVSTPSGSTPFILRQFDYKEF